MLSKQLSILATIILVGAAGCTAAGQSDASEGGDTIAAVADAPTATGTVIHQGQPNPRTPVLFEPNMATV